MDYVLFNKISYKIHKVEFVGYMSPTTKMDDPTAFFEAFDKHHEALIRDDKSKPMSEVVETLQRKYVTSVYKTMKYGSKCAMRRDDDILKRCCYNSNKGRWECVELGYSSDGKPNSIAIKQQNCKKNPI